MHCAQAHSPPLAHPRQHLQLFAIDKLWRQVTGLRCWRCDGINVVYPSL